MLYKLKNNGHKTTFVPLKPTNMGEQGLLEKQMEQWLADNPNAVLPEGEERVLVISQEAPFQNMTDVIAVDEDGNIVVIEVKRGVTPRDVIAQALEYASDVAEWDYDVLNLRALAYFKQRGLDYVSLLDAFTKTFDYEPGEFAENGFNQRQRIFIVGEEVDEKIERTARWLMKRGIAIHCVSYRCYLAEEEGGELFLDLQSLNRPNETQGSPRVSRTGPPPTEQEVIDRLPEDLKPIYLELRRRAFEFGNNIQSYATRANGTLNFKAERLFAEIHTRRQKHYFLFYVRPEGFTIDERQSATVDGIVVSRVPDSYGFSLSHTFKVDVTTDLDAVARLLRQSYSAVATR